jgi:type IV pilus assembly protein PilW
MTVHGRTGALSARSAGVTLVELMIAITIGLFAIGTMSALFAANSRTRAEIERAGQQVENGRFALDLLRDDVRQAGFFGGFVGTAQLTSPCVPRTGVVLTAANLGWDPVTGRTPPAIHGYPATEIPVSDTCLSNASPGSDVLILRSVESAAVTVAVAAGAGFANDWYQQASTCADAAIDPAASPFVVAPGGAGAATRFTLHEKDCITPAPLWRLVVRAYYVGRCSVCSGAGDGIPTLRMVELSGSSATSAAVVEGIEAIRVDYAFDLAGAGRVDTLRRCRAAVDPCSAADWPRLAAVQIHLLARSLGASAGHRDAKTFDMGLAGTAGPFDDGYRRRLYAAQIAVPNLTGPREP